MKAVWHRSLAVACIATLFVVGLAAQAHALQPPRPGEVERLRNAGKLDESLKRARALGNDRMAPGLLGKIAPTNAMPGKPMWPVFTNAAANWDWPLYSSMPSKGVVRVPVVLIDFWDYPIQTTPAEVQQLMTGDGYPGYAPMESLRNFYLRSSYNQLDVQAEVLGVYHYPGLRSSVDSSTGESEIKLVQQAFASFDAQGADFSRYDSNNDGAVDYEVVYWAGPNGDWATFWWGHFGYGGNQDFLVDGKRLGQWSWQWSPTPTNASASVVIHETGHALGLPDLYDYDDTVGPRGGVGAFDMMGGSCDHNGFSKWLLGWLTPTAVSTGSSNLSLRPTASYPDAAIVMPRLSLVDPRREFFLVQTRDSTGNDSTGVYPTTSSLQIWHVDATAGYWNVDWTNFRANNSYTEHKLVRLMEADGKEHLESGGYTDQADLYQPGQSFGPATIPNSHPYYGSDSGVSISSIARTGSALNLVAGIGPYDCDFTPPVSASSVPSGWVNHDVTVDITASDALPYSTIVAIPAWGDGAVFQDFTGFGIGEQGTTRVDFRSIDYAGNAEATQTAYARIDYTPPEVRISPAASYIGTATVSITASDGLSGVASRSYSIDSGPWQSGSKVVCFVPGWHDVAVAAEDAAGNRSEFYATLRVYAPTSVSLANADATVSYGTRVPLRGSVASEGAARAGAPLRVETSADGSTWKATAVTGATGSNGAYAITIVPSVRAYYRVRALGDGDFATSVSRGVRLTPRALVYTPIAPSSATHGVGFTAYGYLKPRHSAGAYAVKIYKYRYVSGAWKSYGYVSAKVANYSSYSKYAASVKLPYAGRWRLRAYHADAGHAASWSAGYDYLTVK